MRGKRHIKIIHGIQVYEEECEIHDRVRGYSLGCKYKEFKNLGNFKAEYLCVFSDLYNILYNIVE